MTAKSKGTTENKLSARGVLEEIGKKIKDKRKNQSKYTDKLKGTLWKAQFLDGLYKTTGWGLRSGPSDACSLQYQFHTNITTDSGNGRNPCHGRKKNRFDENAESYCNSDKIRGNENNSKGGACAPPRRQHICDKNLEFLDNSHTDDTDDLLGNVLVTAKYEGETIVQNHPNTKTSDVCTALARSFADIGDIVRGRDMFKSNERDAVQNGLREVFKKINNSLNNVRITEYDSDPNYYKLREDWWTVNRDQVWKAITCFAPGNANYFIYKSHKDFNFSDGKCGHSQEKVPTNLDYVPQFLRWFEEWSEEFCRIKKIKIDKVKRECGGKNESKYCSREGYDCNKTDLKKNEIFMDLECPKCEKACTGYNEWIEKKKKEFNKQKKKYAKEIKESKLGINSENGRYDKTFYDDLKTSYKEVNRFFELLNNGPICQNIDEKYKIDYNNQEKTFSNSEHCKSCPIFNLKCENGQCDSLDDIICRNIQTIPNISTYKIENPININMLVNNNKIKELSDDLYHFNQCDLFKKLKRQNWNCKNKCNLDVCELQNFEYGIDDEKHMLIDVLIKRWLKYFLKDYNKLKENLNPCINKEKKYLQCIKGCMENCECVEKWIKEKEKEWQDIKERYLNQYVNKNYDMSNSLNKILEQSQFKDDLEKAKGGFKDLGELKKLSKCSEPRPSRKKECKQKDIIETLLFQLNKKVDECKNKHNENNGKACHDILPKPLNDEDGDGDDVDHAESGVCDKVKTLIGTNDGRNLNGTCNTKNYNGWKCDSSDVHSDHDGACMPPRRQSLCVHFLEQLSKGTKSDLREAFIKSAAAETFFSWQYYKSKNGGADLQTKLENGKIPEDFMRIMFYTFADYRDFLFGTDISKNHGKGSVLEKQINSLFENNDGKTTNGKTHQKWWEVNGPQIWKAMLCALEQIAGKEETLTTKTEYGYSTVTFNGDKTTTLEKFAERPQFLRWMTEWGEHFCRERKGKVKELEEGCKECSVNGDGTVSNDVCRTKCMQCKQKCKAYEEFITQWKGQWTQQSEKYQQLYTKRTNDIGSDPIETKFLQYLKKINDPNGTTYDTAGKYVEKQGYIKDCQESKQKNFDKNSSGNNEKDYAFSNYPNEYEKQCTCTDKPVPPPPPQKSEAPKEVVPEKKVPVPPSKKPEVTTVPTPCEIVDGILGTKDGTGYRDGCKTKYGTMPRNEWLCNSSGGKGGSGEKDGDVVCIPPRRQRLYTQKLQTLDDKATQVELRTAFIETAAVENFFQWHEYKQEKIREEKEKQDGLVGATPRDEQQDKLESGEIPEEFLRQMFYTLGDYRDILFGDTEMMEALKSSDTTDMSTINEKIKSIFPTTEGVSKTPGEKSSVQSRDDWWNDYGPDIWHGMLCALTYDTKSKDKNEKVYKELIGNDGKGKNGKYDYESVFFDGGFDESEGGAKKIEDPAGTQTKLSKFVKRPTYFRWLEEWADEFCRKQKHKLGIIKKECKTDEGDNERCSGDGFYCTQKVSEENRTIRGLDCPDCAKNCRFHKKWINKKKEEYDKLQEKYKTEIKDAKTKYGDAYDRNFYTKLEAYSKVNEFLDNLKGEPCKNNNDNDNEDININFEEAADTFKHTEKCDPCPQFKVACEGNGKCSRTNEDGCTNKTIKADNFKKKKHDMKQLHMLVSDKGAGGFDSALESSCKNKDIFEGIRKDIWKCGSECGLHVCTVEKNNKGGGDEKPILMMELLKRWVENFLDDYNKIKHKISHCIKDKTPSTCIKECKGKCDCVGKWLEEKDKEWKGIKEHYLKQFRVKDQDVYELTSVLETLIPQMTAVYDDDDKIIKLSVFDGREACRAGASSVNNEGKDAITCMIKRLQEKTTTCKEKHNDSANNCSTTSYEPTNDNHHDILVSPQEFAPTFCNVPPNACSTDVATNVVGVQVVAASTQKTANSGMLERSRDTSGATGEKGDKSVLEGDIKNAKINGSTKSDLAEGKICSIEKKHSNIDTTKAQEPCYNKGPDRLKIATPWKKVEQKETTYSYVIMPPRRQHFCTSNLEHLKTGNEGLSNSIHASHSLLVDVLLAAKSEAQDIKSKYKQNEGKGLLSDTEDKATVCRSIRYSFADIADIIRGKDMWDKNSGEEKTQRNLQTVFGEIKKQLKGKYNSDTGNMQLRSDWWEANRDQVWEAMKCEISNLNDRSITTQPNGYCGYSDHTPLDDYIPQRLRWMTEWAEWYCKYQSQEYTTLMKQCKDCRSKGKNCMNGNSECKNCKPACDEYWKKIEPWKQQWETISNKYGELYTQATTSGTTARSGPSTNDKDKDVVAFLKKLHEKNKESNKIYSTAEGYIHQEAHISECQKQTRFCGTDSETNFAFRDKPHDHVEACGCDNRKPQVPPRPRSRWGVHWLEGWGPSTRTLVSWRGREKRKITTCDIVEDIIKKSNDGKKPIDGCHSKNNDNNYPKWECEKYIDKSHTGACMPPRRQKICTHYLEKPMKNTDDLKNAFIKCAAAETFLLWQKYKKDKNGGTNDLDNTLKGGTIPEDFKRQMLYTFGDYRDLCLGTDLSSKTDTSSGIFIVKNNIDHVFYKIGQSTLYHRTNWWEKNTKDIWEGMLCALSYDTERKKIDYNVRSELTDAKNNNTFDKVTFGSDGTSTLSKFSEQPQFFRWFTEWGDKFCRERIIKIKDLETKCSDCNVVQSAMRDGIKTCDDKDKCDTCKEQCKKYKEWLGTWKTQYITQRKKYTAHNVKDPYKSIDDVTRPKHAYQYLNEQLKQFTCENGDCNCMENASTESQTKESMKGDMPASMDDTPSEYKDKCNCVRDECTGLSVTNSGFADFSAFGGGVSNGKCNELKGGSPKKMEIPQYDPTNDILKSTIPVGIALALGSIAFLFMKKKPKSTVDLLSVIDIHKGDYGIPTLKSKNRYIPYRSGPYKGKTYIYMEGDSSGDEKYAFMSDTTDITSSESEYEEMDINDIYVPGSPKYKTLIEVVLEPSGKTQNDIHSDDIPNNKLTDEEWNQMKHDFISQYLQSEPNDVPNNNYRSGDIPLNTQPNTLYFDNPEEKPFIMSIHDRDLYTGEEYSYDMTTNSGKNNVYSGIDLINDALSGDYDIYDEVLKRKENELFGTNHHTKRTTTNRFAKPTNSDPIMNQLDLLHKWLDKHRDMCEKWENHHERLAKLKEKWDNETPTSGNKHSDNIPSDTNKTLNTNVSIEIDMDNPKRINQFSNMDINPDNSSMDKPTMDNMEDDYI
ncbi:erythrocyte membrane protein 1, EMP1 [Plasmodium reichenowi]|uniref:Erythrocyte membrane protein 1, EMP1 n=1 Tax=Plasmodium reichenowi TaxID=5854 RepID=A0A060RQ14_PLARE|nr:erythrocyte membrane protein 1, EMP1 [Plasmodium reichenowi]